MNANRALVLVMVFFAVLLAGGGIAAFIAAPPQANPKTALIIPGSCAALMLLCAAGTHVGLTRGKRMLAMIFGHAGIVLPLLFALLFLPPAMARTKAQQNYPEARIAFEQAQSQGQVFTPEARKAFFRERQSPDHDQRYLVVTLWSLIVLSVVSGIVLIVLAMRSRREALAARAQVP